MVSAPITLVERDDDARRTREASPEDTAVSDVDYAERRLRGTLFERRPTVALYRMILAAGPGLVKIGVSASSLTLASLALAGGASLAAATGYFPVACALVLASGACDVLDGIVARAANKATRYGALLDSTVDRFSDGLPLLGVAVFYAEHGAIVAIPALTMLGGFSVSYVRARAEALGGTLPPLFMRRAERVLLLVLTFALGSLSLDVVPVRAPFVLLGVALMGLLSLAGTWSALRRARQVLLAPRHGELSESSQ
jgi:CDP-diacylglycerol--glycerol-3-phosphate 3-phosphatidyltransferase